MKAVLCLWAREHLKGRLGPGSGLALLLKKGKKKETTLSSVHVRVCVFGKERQNRTDRLGRDTEDQSRMPRGDGRTSPTPHLSSPQWQVGPPSRYDHRRGAGKVQRGRAVPAGGAEGEFQLRIFFLCVSMWERSTWATEPLPAPAPSRWIITWATPESSTFGESHRSEHQCPSGHVCG